MVPDIRVLLVEDDVLIAEDLRQTLEELGYGIAGVYHTYDEGVRALPQGGFDVVLLDINLGSKEQQASGLELARQLRCHSDRPFLFLTAYSDSDTIRQATALRPAGYLIKPSNKASLFAAIQTALENTAPAPAAVPESLLVRLGTRTHRLLWDDVCSLEAGKNYVRIQSVGSVQEYPVRGTLNSVLDTLLPPRLRPRFLRVSRSVCLHARHISGFKGEQIFCGGRLFENTRIPVRELAALLQNGER